MKGIFREYRRYYTKSRFRLHEAFHPGDVITVHAVLPDELPIADFQEMLSIGGRYKGISPFGSDKQFGTFTVQGVKPKKREASQQ